MCNGRARGEPLPSAPRSARAVTAGWRIFRRWCLLSYAVGHGGFLEEDGAALRPETLVKMTPGRPGTFLGIEGNPLPGTQDQNVPFYPELIDDAFLIRNHILLPVIDMLEYHGPEELALLGDRQALENGLDAIPVRTEVRRGDDGVSPPRVDGDDFVESLPEEDTVQIQRRVLLPEIMSQGQMPYALLRGDRHFVDDDSGNREIVFGIHNV